ncbi:MAG: hypothetical protein ACLFVK_08340 [Dehalococcoidia bacterium]
MGSIGWYIFAIVFFPTVLMLVDAWIGYKRKREEPGKEEPKGISGFRRAIIALTVIIILGIAVFHLLASGDSGSEQVVSNILSMLAGLVAAIAGFYFGGRFGEKNAEQVEKRAEGAEKRAENAEAELRSKREKEGK